MFFCETYHWSLKILFIKIINKHFTLLMVTSYKLQFYFTHSLAFVFQIKEAGHFIDEDVFFFGF